MLPLQLGHIFNLPLGRRELCGSFLFLSGMREQLLLLALRFFLLELSEQSVFCVLVNNKGAF